MSHRPWRRFHWLTWGAILAIAIAIGQVQFQESLTRGLMWMSYGWPFIARQEPFIYVGTQLEVAQLRREFPKYFVGGICANLLAGLTILAASAIATERWLRHDVNRFQFSIQTMLGGAVIIGALLTFVRCEAQYFAEAHHTSFNVYNAESRLPLVSGWPPTILNRYRWYTSVPLLFGVGCTTYISGLLALSLVRRCRNTVVRHCGVRNGASSPPKLRESTLTIRSEHPSIEDYIRLLLESAFPTPAEARLVDALRANGNLLASLVAEVDGQVVGHVAFSPVTIGDGTAQVRGAGLAPVAVAKAWRRRGIAGQLIREGLAACQTLGMPFVVVLGESAYYSRFGFKRAADYGITNEYGVDHEFRMIELAPGSLPAAGGQARYGPEFAALADQPPAAS